MSRPWDRERRRHNDAHHASLPADRERARKEAIAQVFPPDVVANLADPKRGEQRSAHTAHLYDEDGNHGEDCWCRIPVWSGVIETGASERHQEACATHEGSLCTCTIYGSIGDCHGSR